MKNGKKVDIDMGNGITVAVPLMELRQYVLARIGSIVSSPIQKKRRRKNGKSKPYSEEQVSEIRRAILKGKMTRIEMALHFSKKFGRELKSIRNKIWKIEKGK